MLMYTLTLMHTRNNDDDDNGNKMRRRRKGRKRKEEKGTVFRVMRDRRITVAFLSPTFICLIIFPKITHILESVRLVNILWVKSKRNRFGLP